MTEYLLEQKTWETIVVSLHPYEDKLRPKQPSHTKSLYKWTSCLDLLTAKIT